MRRSTAVFFVLAALLATIAPGAARGHDLTISQAELTIAARGTLRLDFTCDLDALALGRPQQTDDQELVDALSALPPTELANVLERLRRQLQRRVKVRVDDRALDVAVSFPDRGSRPSDGAPPTFLGLTARFEAPLPEQARWLSFMASRAFPPVHLTVRDQRLDAEILEILEQGERSTPYDLLAPPSPPSAIRVVGRYLRIGFAHIVPRGLDHVVFVLGLFFYAARLRPLLLQVTAFTAAHSLTLALATLGTVRLPGSVVEPLIALSIVWIAVENLVRGKGSPADRAALSRRMAIVFAFGLLHGLGFAGVLAELGLPRGALVSALLAFNVGVEAGQLAVLASAYALVGWARSRPWFRPAIALPASLAIGGLGLFWLVERLVSVSG